MIMDNYQHTTPPSMHRHQHPLPSVALLSHHSPELSASQQPPQKHQQHSNPVQTNDSNLFHHNHNYHQHNHVSEGCGGVSAVATAIPPPSQPLISNSLAIRQEIQRFESVHPSIYAIYDLIDLLPITDAQIAQQIRDHIVCIEDSFVNSQEWTISRSVPDLRLGIIGSLSSGKSALVHRYLTGSYMQEESPEGGRFKKEVFIDNQSYLLLIRDEGGAPEMQFAAWVDAVIFVFSLENETSFNTIYNYYTKMAHFRNSQELPMILVGTQDAISERNPRVIDDSRARKLANDMKRCSYYETCATYGLNVERVFQDACQKILSQRMSIPTSVSARPTTPQGSCLGIAPYQHNKHSNTNNSNGPGVQTAVSTGNLTLPHRHHALSASSHHIPIRMSVDFAHAEQQNMLPPVSQKTWLMQQQEKDRDHDKHAHLECTNENNNITTFNSALHHQQQHQNHQSSDKQQSHLFQQQSNNEHLIPLPLVPLREQKDNGSNSAGSKDLPTPTSTPTTSRKSRRRSNLFIPSSSKKNDKELKNGEVGSGRSIPIKQGYLYKRSSKSLNKEWKKKYVTLCDDGHLTYHPSLHDYMDNVHGKEIPLQYVTVKVPGQKPRGSKSIITNSALTTSMLSNGKHQAVAGLSEGIGCLSLVKQPHQNDSKKLTEKVLLTAFDTLREPVKSNSSQHTSGDEGIAMSNSNSQTFLHPNAEGSQQQQQHFQQPPSQRELFSVNVSTKLESQTPNVKKRHRRIKSSSVKSNELDDCDGYEFFIVSLDSKQWHFEAANSEERDEWVSVIEREIFKSLQTIESARMKPATTSELASMVAIRTTVPGNGFCCDCDALNPDWASLNLGVLICIECSGVHRNLGSHISKVRSLGLDDWPSSHLSVMLAIGNSLANSVWEANIQNRSKPKPNASHEEKEAWIRSKYEAKEFMASCNSNTNVTLGQQLIEAVIRADMRSVILILATTTSDVTNASVSSRDVRTPLLLACATGNLAIAQLLIWNGANIKSTDHEGRTCLAYAKAAQSLANAKCLKAASAAASAKNTNSNSSSTSNASSSSSTLSSTATTGTTSNASYNQSSTMAYGIPAPRYDIDETTSLVELLVSLGCPESAPLTASGTLPRRRDTLGTPYEKSSAGVI